MISSPLFGTTEQGSVEVYILPRPASQRICEKSGREDEIRILDP